MEKVLIDCTSNRSEAVPLTESEEQQLAVDQEHEATVTEAETLTASRRDAVRAKVEQRIAQAETAHANWNTLSNAQKDNALREVVLAVAKLGRLALARFDVDE